MGFILKGIGKRPGYLQSLSTTRHEWTEITLEGDKKGSFEKGHWRNQAQGVIVYLDTEFE